MKPWIAFVLALQTPMFAQNWTPNKEQDFESNFDCHSDRCISYQLLNNRRPPTIKTANAFITAINYPFELQMCDWGADKLYNVWAIFPDGTSMPLAPHTKAPYPFLKIKVTVKPDLSNDGEDRSKKFDIYSVPRTNLQCQDLRGVDYDVFLVTDLNPHHQVKLAIKRKRKNKGNILKLSQSQQDLNANQKPVQPLTPLVRSPKKIKVHYTKKHEGNKGRDVILEYLEKNGGSYGL